MSFHTPEDKLKEGPGTGKYKGTMGAWNTGANVLGAVSGVAQAYLAYKNYELSKEKFSAEKAAMNANYTSQAMGYNTGLQNSSEVGLALGGSVMSPQQIAERKAYTNSRKLSEKAIV